MRFYPYNILGIMDTLNDWNEKLRNITTGSKNNNVIMATVLLGVVFVVSAWAINYFNKK